MVSGINAARIAPWRLIAASRDEVDLFMSCTDVSMLLF